MSRKWFYPLVYLGLVVISMLPVYTEIPYDPRNSPDVIMNILMFSIRPYQAWGWMFHAATLLLIGWVVLRPQSAGRVLAGYMGINYLIVAAVQTHAVTEKYGFALQTGALVGAVYLGMLWLVTAFKNRLVLSTQGIPAWRYLLIPLALLVFWSPMRVDGMAILPNFDPRLLLTSADYGFTFCFVTPVFLFFLIFFSAQGADFAYRVTAFNGLLYGLFNLMHWFNPDTVWLGVMHLPLFLISLAAVILPRRDRSPVVKPALA